MTTDQANRELLELLRKKAFQKRAVTLVSGKTSNFYVDCKQVTLDAIGSVLVGRALFGALQAYEARIGSPVGGVGGLTLGADPMASALSLTSALHDTPRPAFIVRKEAKGHGTGAYLEGMTNISEGSELVVLEDVITTGGSALKAVERVRAAGFVVRVVFALVDRLEGGRANLEAADLEVVSLFDRRDFIADAEV